MRLLDQLVTKVENASALDGPADKVLAITDQIMSPRVIRDGLSGTWLGHPLHPLLVTVPIGAWVAASVLDFTGGKSMRGAARRLVGLGVLAVAPTAAAGVSDWRYTSGPERRVGLVHALSNQAALVFYGASWLSRKKGRHLQGSVLALAGATCVSAGGFLGGHLSYALGVGVDTTAFEGLPEDWTDVAAENEIPSTGMVSKDVAGTSVLLAKVQNEVVALANRCTHRGGPLAEGRLEENCVRCPWHGSLFSLDNGSVAEGPATRPQPVLQVKVEQGRVFVRLSEADRSSLAQSSV